MKNIRYYNNMIHDEIVDCLEEFNENAITLDMFECALIGVCRQFNRPPVALYDYDKCISIVMNKNNMEYDEALDFFEIVVSADLGDNTPAFMHMLNKEIYD